VDDRTSHSSALGSWLHIIGKTTKQKQEKQEANLIHFQHTGTTVEARMRMERPIEVFVHSWSLDIVALGET